MIFSYWLIDGRPWPRTFPGREGELGPGWAASEGLMGSVEQSMGYLGGDDMSQGSVENQ